MSAPLSRQRTLDDLYERDFYAWTVAQAKALRELRPRDLDWENVSEEIETLGRSEKSEIATRLNVLLLHLLKWQFQPTGRSASWRASIVEQRMRLRRALKENPSLRSYPSEIVAEEYEIARLKAAGEAGLPAQEFPAGAPYTVDQILSDAFYPGAAD